MTAALTNRKYGMLKPPGELHHYLLRWFEREKRAMPWRETRDPYAIWLSETMLQQTQVETVKPYYHRFLEAFPTVVDLAKAELQEVLRQWAGLGYYRRARHMHLAARRMVESHGGRVPGTMEALLSLPGIGRYTAGAVGSIAFGLAVPVVDGNVMRVISRLTGFDGDIGEARNAAFFWKVAEEVVLGAGRAPNPPLDDPIPPLNDLIPPVDDPVMPVSSSKRGSAGRVVSLGVARYGDVNEAMMELGATVCVPLPGVPACGICPVREFCVAFAEGRQGELPVKRRRGEVGVVRGMALVVTRNSNDESRMTKRGKSGVAREVLVMQRPRGVVWEEMWEFPVVEGGGRKTGDGKSGGTLAGWVRGVLGVRVEGVERCGEVVHGLTHRRMEFEVVRGEVGNAKLKTRNSKRGDTENSKLKTQNAKLGEVDTQNDGEVILPVGVGMGGKRYVRWRWVGWPLEGRGELAMGRVVFKVAEAAGGGEGLAAGKLIR